MSFIGSIWGGIKKALDIFKSAAPMFENVEAIDLTKANADDLREWGQALKKSASARDTLGDVLISAADADSPGGIDITLGEAKDIEEALVAAGKTEVEAAKEARDVITRIKF